MKIVIKKKVSLNFLGEGYEEAYITFKTLSIDEYESIAEKAEGLKEDGVKSLQFLKDTLKANFLSGEFPNEAGKLEALSADDLGQFNFEVINECFGLMTGTKQDPKA